MLPGDPQVHEVIRRNFADIHRCISDTVASTQAAGEMTGRWPADAIASQLLALVEGMFVLGRTAQDPGSLFTVVELTLDALRPTTSPGEQENA